MISTRSTVSPCSATERARGPLARGAARATLRFLALTVPLGLAGAVGGTLTSHRDAAAAAAAGGAVATRPGQVQPHSDEGDHAGAGSPGIIRVDLARSGGMSEPRSEAPAVRTAEGSSRAVTGAPGSVKTSAYGLNAGVLGLCLSCANAQAGPGFAGAEARELCLVITCLSYGQVPANGYSGGWLLSLPPNDLVSLAVGRWYGSTSSRPSSSEAHSETSLIELLVGPDGLAGVTVLRSRSSANWDGARTQGHSSSTAVEGYVAGGPTLAVGRSEASNGAPGRVSVVSVNDGAVTPSGAGAAGEDVEVPKVVEVAVLRGDDGTALIGSAKDGKSQTFLDVGSTWAGPPEADPQPLQ